MALEQFLLQTFAQHCTAEKYDDVQVDHERVTARRSLPRGFQILGLELTWKRRSWRLRLIAKTAFFLPGEAPDEEMYSRTMQFWTTPAMLDSRWPCEWQYLQATDPEPLAHTLVEAYEQTLAPHLNAISSPLGLTGFMQEGYQVGTFL